MPDAAEDQSDYLDLNLAVGKFATGFVSHETSPSPDSTLRLQTSFESA